MVTSRDALVYEAIQRIYRPAFVAYARSALVDHYGEAAVERLRRPFKAEQWAEVAAAAARARGSGIVESAVADDFDLLDVSHFSNLVEAEFDVLFPGPLGESIQDRTARRTALLALARLVKSVRDPMSHPVTEEFTLEDMRLAIDAARRITKLFDPDAAERLKALLDTAEAVQAEREPLDADLPPSDVIGLVDFVGRERELDDLGTWLANPDSKRWLLAGAGGRGKTAIAFQFARKVRDSAPGSLTFVLWMSAKRRAFVEGGTTELPHRDFSDLSTAIDRILSAFGFLKDAPNDFLAKRTLCLDLLDKFPTLLVVDDIDTLEGEDESVAEFLAMAAYRTPTRVLMTSRRSLHGMGGSTTLVEGLDVEDGNALIDARIKRFGLDAAIFRSERRKKMLEVTDGCPLFIDDLLRLHHVGVPLDQAIAAWRDRRGDSAREYALGREFELLSRDAREVLVAAAISNQPVSITELHLITEKSADDIESALRELQQLFLVPKPRLIEDAERFQPDYNTRSLVRQFAARRYPDWATRYRAAYQALAGDVGRATLRRRRTGEYVRQAIVFVKSDQHERAEETLNSGLRMFPEDPDLIGQLAWVYKVWKPDARVTDARERFRRARELGSVAPDMYAHWIELERGESQYSVAAEIGDEACTRCPESQWLRYQAGYVHLRLASQLAAEFQLRALEEFARAAEHLRLAILDPSELEDHRSRVTNSKAYGALCAALSGWIRALDARRDPTDSDRLAQLRSELADSLSRWRAEHPGDPYAGEAHARHEPITRASVAVVPEPSAIRRA